ncbi:unannotated protein [freshwater metagenome]|uniref:Unannotated protein n=1 Tax=freshwater metagenome TaxID=449393 RepID=A0A6J6BAI0_9ZZZZ
MGKTKSSNWLASPRSAIGSAAESEVQRSKLLPELGKLSSTKPGTATKSHSEPFAAWTVRICTACLLAATDTGFSPPSSLSAIFNHSRKVEIVPPFRWNFAASSRKASKCFRPCAKPSRTNTSVSKNKNRSASIIASVIDPTKYLRSSRNSLENFSNRSYPSAEKFSLGAFSNTSRASIALPIAKSSASIISVLALSIIFPTVLLSD